MHQLPNITIDKHAIMIVVMNMNQLKSQYGNSDTPLSTHVGFCGLLKLQ